MMYRDNRVPARFSWRAIALQACLWVGACSTYSTSPCAPCEKAKTPSWFQNAVYPRPEYCTWGPVPSSANTTTPSFLWLTAAAQEKNSWGRILGDEHRSFPREVVQIKGFLTRTPAGCALQTSRWEMDVGAPIVDVFVPCRVSFRDLASPVDDSVTQSCLFKDVVIQGKVSINEWSPEIPHLMVLTQIEAIRELGGPPEIVKKFPVIGRLRAVWSLVAPRTGRRNSVCSSQPCETTVHVRCKAMAHLRSKS